MPEHELRNKRLSEYLQLVGEQKQQGHAIEGAEIVKSVMGAINSASSNILMTMDLTEELNSPLPANYHLLLSQKLDRGVRITRVGFGTEQEFLQVAQTRSFPSENFTFKHNPNLEEYQRMILLDGTILFFRYNGVFFRSTDPSLIEQFQQYFSSVSKSQTDNILVI